MTRKLLTFPSISLLSFAAIAALAFWLPAPQPAVALHPKAPDVLSALGSATISSRGGRETINLSGTVTVQQVAHYPSAGFPVIETEIVSMSLTGQSLIGPVTVTEHPSLASTGEIRGLQTTSQFPASSFFDVYARVAAPGPNASLGNGAAIRMNVNPNLTQWPPVQGSYQSAPLENFDNDGDGSTDEDSSDEDGDHMFDEDGPAAGNPDTDALTNEDPSAAECVAQSLSICDDDADGQIDEDPVCVPLFPTMPTGACVVSISLSLYADSDRDGCTDSEEQGSNHLMGGQRNPSNFWDFFDVPTGPSLTRDKALAISDILAVVARFGSTGSPGGDPLSAPPPAPAYHTTYDRTDDPAYPERWRLLGPDGAIAIQDIVIEVASFGDSCMTPP